MSLALKWGDNNTEDGGFIFFDAITAYSQNYSGQVTKHPIDAGASVVDHYVKNNPVFTLSAVITGVDVSTGSYLIQDTEGNTPVNTRPAPSAVSVNSTNDSILSQYLPSSIGQFLPFSTPNVVMDEAREELIDQIRDALIDLTSGSRFNEQTDQVESNIQLVKLFEYKETFLNRVVNNLVITNIKFNEVADTGYALYCDITFEQVMFASLRLEEIPKDVQEALRPRASTRRSQGMCDSTERNTEDPDNTDPDSKKEAIEDSDPLRTVGE
tara:strand:- start:57945 stop:58751 length:807 start_codon:yes stop_codon:yes gene_type:complete